jgi:putative N6-adenine-specific DNA methylase
MEKYYAICTPGFERLAADELCRLGLLSPISSPELSQEPGGVEFEGDLEALYKANLHLRTINRILVRLGTFYATDYAQLRQNASRLPWKRYIAPGQPVAIRVSCSKSKLNIDTAVARSVVGALEERFGQVNPVQNWDDNAQPPLPQLIIVRLAHNRCTISLDSSGPHLHRRGYRLASAKAPMRENLAAGMLLLSGWDQTSPLLDPFCGSGTIPIEASLLASQIPSGFQRQFAFTHWLNFDSAIWENLRQTASQQKTDPNALILASDRDAGAIQIAQQNAERAGVLSSIHFSHQAVSAITPPTTHGWLVTNPPYGVRVSPKHDLRDLYARFGQIAHEKCRGWRVAVMCNDDKLIAQTHFKITEKVPLSNGGIPVCIYLGKIV